MFKIGDKVVYGHTGVCEISDICEKELIRNQKRQYYILKPLFQQNNIIYAPCDSDKVFMRYIMTKDEAEDLISRIPHIKSSIKSENYDIEKLKAELRGHRCDDLISLTIRIYEKRKTARENNKKIGFSDEKYMRLAEDLLFGELSVSLGIPKDNVQEYIKNKLA